VSNLVPCADAINMRPGICAKLNDLVDVNYLDRSATTILAGGSGE